MKMRRGSNLWPGDLGLMVYGFQPGDVVVSTMAGGDGALTGVVREVFPNLNKVMVAWNGGSVVQHDPDEIMLNPHANEIVRERFNSLEDERSGAMSLPIRVARRMRGAIDVPPDFQGDPKDHGIDEPRGGGFSIMQNLQKDLHEESYEESGVKPPKTGAARHVKWGHRDAFSGHVFGHSPNAVYFYGALKGEKEPALHVYVGEDMGTLNKNRRPDDVIPVKDFAQVMKVADDYERNTLSRAASKTAMVSGVTQQEVGRSFSAAVRQAMYWCAPDRTYRLTKGEQDGNSAICPKCKAQMENEPFTRSEKMWRCPQCGFKVPTGKVTTTKVEIEVEPDGEVEVEVTTARLKPRRVR